MNTSTYTKRRFMRICTITTIIITFTNMQESFVSRIFMNTSTLKKIMLIPTGRIPSTGTIINRCHTAPGEYIPSRRVPYESVNQGPQIAAGVRQASTDRRQSLDKNGGDGNRYCIGGDQKLDWPENDPDRPPLST